MEFKAFPKLPRFNRQVVVTEKIDGTNACVIIEEVTADFAGGGEIMILTVDETPYAVGAQSRNRLISPASDNAGFARFVFDNAEALVRLLGAGYHYGEWWGKGIQRGYGIQGRVFSLFNSKRWHYLYIMPQEMRGGTISCVPIIMELDAPDTGVIESVVQALREFGSIVAEGAKAEGVVLYHTASGQYYKVLCENDNISKTEAGVK